MDEAVMLILLLGISVFSATTSTAAKLDLKSPMPAIIGPTRPSNKTQLSIIATIRYGGTYGFAAGPLITESIRIGVDAVQQAGLLPDYELIVEPIDNQCLRDVGVKAFVRAVEANGAANNRIPLFLGSECSEQVDSGQIAKFYNFTGLTMVGVAKIYSEKQKFSSYYALEPTVEIFYKAMAHFIKRQGWSRVYLLSETVALMEAVDQELQENLKPLNVTVAGTAKIFYLTGTYPTPEAIETAVQELKAFGPRIIIMNTNYGTQTACWLHRYGLFGPSYVFLSFPTYRFKPDSPTKYRPWCTEEMLFQILKSVIIFSHELLFATYIPPVDSLGTSSKSIGETISSRVATYENGYYYDCCRTFLYEQLVTAAFVLNATESQLQLRNQTLSDWVTNGRFFRENGGKFMQMLMRNSEDVVYSGFSVNLNKSLNARRGVTVIAQYQVVKPPLPNQTSSFSELISETVIGAFDDRKPNAQIEVRGQIVWQTWNGQTPFDSLRIIQVKVPLMTGPAQIGTLAVSSVLILCEFALLAFNIYQRSSLNKDTLPLFNSLILIGGLTMLLSVLLAPFDGNEGVHANCMARLFVLATGFSIMIGASIAKMSVAKAWWVAQQAGSVNNNNNLQRFTMTILSSASNSNNRESDRRSRYNPRENSPKKLVTAETLKAAIFSCVVVVLMVAWFCLSPIQAVRFLKRIEFSSVDLNNLAYQPFTYTCSINSSGQKLAALIIQGALVACFAVAFVRAWFLSFVLRRTPTRGITKDLAAIRWACYAVPTTALLGSAVLGFFFSSDSGSLESAISVVTILLNLESTFIIFTPQLYAFKVARRLPEVDNSAQIDNNIMITMPV